MANTAGESAETASEQLTAIWNNFYDGSKSIEYYADVMVSLGASTASSSEEIAAGIQKFAAVANTVGLSYEYAAAALATLTANTREAPEVIGNSLKTLFARLQGLSLGDTLDDGTDLNKYSKALQSVGVDILDVNGNLKGMDQLLDETAAKWGTLSEAQKTALAQTVAGVRQYGQFISLMENWGDFEKNLQTAYGSEGALDKQAQIYAESWEAARKRVKASAEDIYDSLINEDFFIGFDNSLSLVLDRIADIVDAVGGMKGVLFTAGQILTRVYGNQLAESLRNAVYNLSIFRKIEQQRAIDFKKSSLDSLTNIIGESGDTSGAIARTQELYANQAEAQIEANKYMENFSEYQKAQVLNEERLLELLTQRGARQGEITDELNQQTEALKHQLSLNQINGSNTASVFNELSKNDRVIDDWIDIFTTVKDTMADSGYEVDNITGLNRKELSRMEAVLGTLQEKIVSITILTEGWNTANENAESDIAGAGEQVEYFAQRLEKLGTSGEEAQAEIAGLQGKIDAIKQLLVEGYGYSEDTIEQYLDSIRQTTEAGENQSTTLYRQAQAAEAYREKIKQVANQQQDWAEAIVSVGNVIFSLSMMLQSFQSTVEIFNDEDVSDVEKFTAAITTLTLALPQLMRGYKALDDAVKGQSRSVIANTIVTTINAGKQKLFGGAASAAAQGATAAAGATAALSVSLGQVLLVIGVVVAAGYGLIKLLDFLIVTEEELIEKQNEAKEAIDKTNESVAEQEEKFKSLEEQLKSTKDRLDSLLAQDTLTVIEEEEISKLKEEIALLERQYEIEKELRKINAEKAAAEYLEKDQDTGVMEKVEKGPDYKTLQYQFGTYGDLIETQDLDLWYQKQKEYLDNLYKGFTDTEEYNIRLGKLNDEYREYQAENKAIYAEWANSLSEDADRIQTQYNNLITWVNEGVLEREDYQGQIDNYLQQLEAINKARFQDQYAQIYIYPTIDNTALKNVRKQIYSLQDYSNMADSDILKKLGLSSDDVKETIHYLDTLAISLKDVIATVQKELGSAREKMAKMMGGNFAQEFLDQISGEDLSLLAQLNWDIDAENPINNFEDMLDAMAHLVIKTQDWTTSLDEAKGAAREAIDILKDGDDLDSEAITNLQDLFASIGTYDLSNLENLSSFEQAMQISEAYLSLENVQPVIDQLNETIIQNRSTIKELDEDLQKLGYDSSKTYAEMRVAANKVNDSNEEVGETWEAIQEKLLNKSALQAQVDDAIDQLERLNEFKMDPIEIEIAKVDTVIAQMKQVEKAASLIGEGFKVEVENVAELAKTLPELLLDAWVDEATGVVNLQQSVVEAVAQSTQDIVSTQAQGLGESLQNRIEATNAEIHLLQAVKEAAIQGSSDVVAAVTSDSKEQQEVKRQVAIAIMKAAIQQAIEERVQSRGTADETAFYMNETSRIAGVEGANTAKNWAKAFQDVANSAQKAFNQIAQYQKNPDSASGKSITITSGINAAGMSSGTSQLGVYTGNAGKATKEEQLTLDYLTSGGNLSSLLPEGMAFESAAAEAIMRENARIIADTFNDALKMTVAESENDILSGAWIDKLYPVLGDKLPDYLEDAISMDFKDLGRDIDLQSRLKSIQGVADQLRNSGLAKDKSKSKSGSSKDNTGKTYDEEDAKTLEDIEDRYHEITREILRQSDLLDDIGNDLDRAYGIDKLKKYKKEQEELNKQLTNYQKKLSEATERYLPQDTQKLRDLFGAEMIDSRIKANGELKDYEDLLNYAQDQHQQFINDYNEQYIGQLNALAADKDAQEAWLQSIREDGLTQEEYWKQRKEAADADYEAREKALEKYEETRDVIQEVRDGIEDTLRAIADNRLSQIEYRLEIVIDVKNMKDAIREFDKHAAEIFNDALTHGLDVAKLSKDQAYAEAEMYPEYKKQYEDLVAEYESADDAVDRDRIIQNIKELQGKVLDSAEAIVDWINSIEDIVPEAVDAAATRFKLFTDQLEHNTTVLDTIKELYALQGVTYKTMDGFNRLQKVSQEKLEAQVAEAKLQKAWYDEAIVNLQEAQAALDSLGGDEKDLRYDTYKKARDAYLEEFNKAQEAYLSLAQEAMETAQQMYLDQIEKAVYEFGQAVSGGLGLDLLQDKYDHYIEKDERYFDKVNEAYQTTSWFNKLQADIDAATNQQTKDRLKALQEEINVRREGNKLSQYDLDILNAKYEVLKAQMALEDAQNAKNKIELVRDRQGNWNYQYTADPTQIENAEQDLIDAEIEWYNIAKQQVTDVTGEIISTWQECQDKIKEIYSDMTLTDQERSDRAQEIYEYYSDKIKYLEEEKQVAIKDMTDAGNASLLASAVIMGDELTDLTGITSEDIKNIVDQGGKDVIGLLTADNETIKNIIAGNVDLIDLFDNAYAKDLDNMTNNTANFEDQLRNTLGEAEQDFLNYKDVVNDVANETGTTLDDLAATTDQVSDSTDQLEQSGLQAAAALWDMIDAAQDLAWSYADMAQEIWGTVEALRALAEAQMEYVSSKADLGNSSQYQYDPSVDYSGLIATGIANGTITVGDDTYNQLMGFREQKIKDLGLSKDYYHYNETEAKDIFQNIASGGTDPFWKIMGFYSEQEYLQYLRQHGIAGFDTGGYTGDFTGSKLAFLHEKELVLNKEDTENILTAVAAVRTIGADLFANLEKAIDSNTIAAMSLMGQRASIPPIDSTSPQLEQYLTIERVEFPNVTNSNEIEQAFANLANDASQYVRRRLD